jgi:hypothetical protein
MVRALLQAAACSLLFVQAAGAAFAAGVEFSAEAQTTDLQSNQSATARMFVGKDGMQRKEFLYGNQQIIEIIRPRQGVLWQLLPNSNSYYEYKIPEAAAKPRSDNPCAAAPALQCSLLGEENIHGRLAKKWRISGKTPQGEAQRTLWIDKERKIPLRQENEHGDVAELRLLGKEQLAGRAVEKWEMSMTREQQTFRSLQWYDPRLQLTIREEVPGRSLKELSNIKEGPQGLELFQVPAGYQKQQFPAGEKAEYPQQR